ncbi:MAG: DUF11 domain-containing protein, partial [Propionibacteriaceae bacterium]|nr:DUF11 domain-containing protein [Propionibacteriaceae bacterium]
MSSRSFVFKAGAFLASVALAIGFTSAAVPVVQATPATSVCIAGDYQGWHAECGSWGGDLVQSAGNPGLWSGIITLPADPNSPLYTYRDHTFFKPVVDGAYLGAADGWGSDASIFVRNAGARILVTYNEGTKRVSMQPLPNLVEVVGQLSVSPFTTFSLTLPLIASPDFALDGALFRGSTAANQLPAGEYNFHINATGAPGCHNMTVGNQCWLADPNTDYETMITAFGQSDNSTHASAIDVGMGAQNKPFAWDNPWNYPTAPTYPYGPFIDGYFIVTDPAQPVTFSFSPLRTIAPDNGPYDTLSRPNEGDVYRVDTGANHYTLVGAFQPDYGCDASAPGASVGRNPDQANGSWNPACGNTNLDGTTQVGNRLPELLDPDNNHVFHWGTYVSGSNLSDGTGLTGTQFNPAHAGMKVIENLAWYQNWGTRYTTDHGSLSDPDDGNVGDNIENGTETTFRGQNNNVVFDPEGWTYMEVGFDTNGDRGMWTPTVEAYKAEVEAGDRMSNGEHSYLVTISVADLLGGAAVNGVPTASPIDDDNFVDLDRLHLRVADTAEKGNPGTDLDDVDGITVGHWASGTIVPGWVNNGNGTYSIRIFSDEPIEDQEYEVTLSGGESAAINNAANGVVSGTDNKDFYGDEIVLQRGSVTFLGASLVVHKAVNTAAADSEADAVNLGVIDTGAASPSLPTVAYTFTLDNPGHVDFSQVSISSDALSNSGVLSLSPDFILPVSFPLACPASATHPLVAGATGVGCGITLYYTPTVAAVNAGDAIENVVQITGTHPWPKDTEGTLSEGPGHDPQAPQGNPSDPGSNGDTDRTNDTATESDQDPAWITLQAGVPDLEITKTEILSGLSSPVAAGDVISYQISVVNSASATGTAANVVVVDRNPGVSDLLCDWAGSSDSGTGAGLLSPGEVLSCSASYAVTQADIDSGATIANWATVSCSAPGCVPSVSVFLSDAVCDTVADGADPLSSCVDVTVGGVPDLVLSKSQVPMSGVGLVAGATVDYTVSVVNNGSATATNVVVTDYRAGVVLSCSGLLAGSLAPGGTVSCTGSYTVTQA